MRFVLHLDSRPDRSQELSTSGRLEPIVLDERQDMSSRKRRSARILARVPIHVTVVDRPRRAVTAVINRHGALILSSLPWPIGAVLEITNERTNLTTKALVVFSGGQNDQGQYKLGVEFERPPATFWGADYQESPTPAADNGAVEVTVTIDR